jgi:hypothetical protein
MKAPDNTDKWVTAPFKPAGFSCPVLGKTGPGFFYTGTYDKSKKNPETKKEKVMPGPDKGRP